MDAFVNSALLLEITIFNAVIFYMTNWLLDNRYYWSPLKIINA